MNIKNIRKFKRLLAITASIASMSYSTANACNGVLDDVTNAEGTHKGFYYNFWKQTAKSNVQVNCEEDGNFSASWNNVFNWKGGKGWDPGGPRVVSYSGTFNSEANQDSQNAYLMLYGWTREPFIEYYVVESYGTYNPSGCASDIGSFQSDGASYDILECQHVSQGGTGSNYKQYFSIRNPPLPWGEVRGTITVANHFNEWAKLGMSFGGHDYMIVGVEGYSGNSNAAGDANLTISEGSLEPLGPIAPQCGSLGGVPVCCSIKADPDRDGMGEENGEVCTVTSATQGTHPDNPSDVLAAINVGGDGDAILRNGIWYEPSTYVTGGQVNTTQDYVSGAHGSAIFQSELSGDLSFSIPISNQQVSVELSFVEFTHTAPGERIFIVDIENERVMINVDLFAQVGHDTVWRPSPFVADVTDGTLNINLYGYVDKATLSSVLVRKSTNSSGSSSGGGTAGAIDAWFLLILASGLLARARRLFPVKNRRILKFLLAITASIAAMSYSTANACSGALDDTTNAVGTHEGYYYSFWKQTAKTNVQINCEEGGNFSARWSNVFNWVGGKGWNPGGPRVVSYSGTFLSRASQDSKNSSLMLYGWTNDPLIEYRIVESYGTYNPSSCAGVAGLLGGGPLGSFESDGASYDVLQCWRYSQGGFGPDYKQYFSVRNPPLPWGEVRGTITVANHFDEWAKHGMSIGDHDYMILAVDDYNGDSNASGSVNLTISEGPLEPLTPQCGTRGGVPICCSIKADPDRDGMGEEDGEVCTITSATQGTHPENPSDVLAAINVGGDGDAIERNGIWYEPSTYVTGGQVNTTQDYISGAFGNAIFQSELSGDLRFSIPISHQQVSVELSFVEFTHTAAEARAFDVTIENQRVMENVDVFAEVGHDTVWIPSPFVVDVTDGTLNINLDGYVGNGTLSSVLVRKSAISSGGAAGAIDAWFLLIIASGIFVRARRVFAVKNKRMLKRMLAITISFAAMSE